MIESYRSTKSDFKRNIIISSWYHFINRAGQISNADCKQGFSRKRDSSTVVKIGFFSSILKLDNNIEHVREKSSFPHQPCFEPRTAVCLIPYFTHSFIMGYGSEGCWIFWVFECTCLCVCVCLCVGACMCVCMYYIGVEHFFLF